MRRIPTNTFDREWLILCEGESDKRFLDRLIQFHNITPERFDVHFPSRDNDPTGGGRGKFGQWLATSYDTSQSFRDNVKAVLLVSDNDDDQTASFYEVVSGLTATKGFPIPDRERIVVRQKDYPAVAILMIPMGERGNLETICVRAALDKGTYPPDPFLPPQERSAAVIVVQNLYPTDHILARDEHVVVRVVGLSGRVMANPLPPDVEAHLAAGPMPMPFGRPIFVPLPPVAMIPCTDACNQFTTYVR